MTPWVCGFRIPEIPTVPQSLLWAHQPAMYSHTELTWSLHPVSGMSSHCSPFIHLSIQHPHRGVGYPNSQRGHLARARGRSSRDLGWPCNLSSKAGKLWEGRETVIFMLCLCLCLWWDITLQLSPAILLVTWPISGTPSSDFVFIHLRVQIELKLSEDWEPQCSPRLVTPTMLAWCDVSTFISGWSVSQTALYS